MTNPRRNTLIFFSLAILVQLGILFSFQFSQQRLLAQGRSIEVQAIPVDPRDLFRGDYVTLSFQFSRIDRTKITDTLGADLPRSTKIYVKLKQPVPTTANASSAPDWQPIAVSRRPFDSVAADEIMLAGFVTHHTPQDLNITYGCESYYVPEGEGRPIETEIQEHKISVKLSVTPRGQARPTELMVDGKEVKFGKQGSKRR